MRVLLMGGTGAMGSHLRQKLVGRGCDVTVTSRRSGLAADGASVEVGDSHDLGFLGPLLARGWDAVVDFMVYSTAEFRERLDLLLAHTEQYVFLSSYRVYADSPMIVEGSPRLLDACGDEAYLATDEYALAKARCEDLLGASGRHNWTVVRPAVTYGGAVGRLQLGPMESGEWLWRALRGIAVPMPGEVLECQATMTWGGDVARMIAGLVGNPRALGEAYTVSGSDHMSWGKVAEAYGEVVPLDVVPCDLGRFLAVRGGEYQVRYDRMFDRVIDNSKVLLATGIRQDELTPMHEGLIRELGEWLLHGVVSPSAGSQARLDRITGGTGALRPLLKDGRGAIDLVKYAIRRFVG